MPQLDLSLLGPMKVLRDGEPITRFATDRERALLAYLAAEAGRPHRREALASLLWGNQPGETALASLRRSLHRLRQALGDDESDSPFLLVNSKTVQFNLQVAPTIDMLVFQDRLNLAQAHRHRRAERCDHCRGWLEAAAAAYQGDFMQGFTLPDSVEFDEWLVIKREQLRLLALDLFERLASRCEQRGDFMQAQHYARRQVEMEPWRESAHRQLMSALARSGNRAAALAQYESCRRVLADELGVEPEEATAQLYARIKQGERWEAVAEPPTNLPSVPTSFIGREADLQRLRDRLQDPDCRLLTLTGPGGVGKTRLAIQAAAEQRPAFVNGVFFVSLAAVRHPALVPDAIAQALTLRDEAKRSPLDSLKQYLRDKELVLVLDNFEHLLDAATVISDLLHHCPQICVIVTSREPLRLTGEHLYPVPPLALPAAASPRDLPAPEVLSQSGAVRLFVKRVQAVRPDYVLTSADSWAVVEICRRLDGLPLAIELAAARASSRPPSLIAEQIGAALHWQADGPRDLPARQQTLRAAIGWSYDALDEAEKRLFRRMAVFLGEGSSAAIEAVCGEPGDSPPAPDVLASLQDKSLLQRADVLDETRFAMLETIREFAAEQLEASGEAEIVRRRHALANVTLAEQAETGLASPNQSLWLNRVERDHANLCAAMGWALENGEAEAALRIGGSLWRFWYSRGHLAWGRQWLEKALARRDGLPAPVQAKALNGAGGLAYAQGDYGQAQKYYEESLVLRRALDDKWGIGVALNNLGLVARNLGNYPLAVTLFDESLAVCREQGDQIGIAYCLTSLGELARRQGDYRAAADFYEQSLAQWRELKNSDGMATALHNLGYVAQYQNDPRRAAALFQQALMLFRELGNKRGTANCLDGLACALAADPDRRPEQAVRLFGAAEALRDTIGATIEPADRVEHDQGAARARARLDPAAFEAAWAAGHDMPLEETLKSLP